MWTHEILFSLVEWHYRREIGGLKLTKEKDKGVLKHTVKKRRLHLIGVSEEKRRRWSLWRESPFLFLVCFSLWFTQRRRTHPTPAPASACLPSHPVAAASRFMFLLIKHLLSVRKWKFLWNQIYSTWRHWRKLVIVIITAIIPDEFLLWFVRYI